MREYKKHFCGNKKRKNTDADPAPFPTSKVELIVAIVNRWKILKIVTKYSFLDVGSVLDLALKNVIFSSHIFN